MSVTHPVLSMTMNQWDDTLYKDGEGRIFSCCSGISIRMNRVYKAWPELMVDAGALKKGDRVGIISQQPGGIATDNRDAIENALLPSLEKVGREGGRRRPSCRVPRAARPAPSTRRRSRR